MKTYIENMACNAESPIIYHPLKGEYGYYSNRTPKQQTWRQGEFDLCKQVCFTDIYTVSMYKTQLSSYWYMYRLSTSSTFIQMMFVNELNWKEILHGRRLLEFVITVLFAFSNLLSIHKFEAEYLYTVESYDAISTLINATN